MSGKTVDQWERILKTMEEPEEEEHGNTLEDLRKNALNVIETVSKMIPKECISKENNAAYKKALNQ
tara:strand:- start:12 stop:209 length:198 start_codon:yes stop_codon:yes gene_type:complete